MYGKHSQDNVNCRMHHATLSSGYVLVWTFLGLMREIRSREQIPVTLPLGNQVECKVSTRVDVVPVERSVNGLYHKASPVCGPATHLFCPSCTNRPGTLATT